MKIYADKLERRDLFDALPRGCNAEVETILKPRVRRCGWNVRLDKPGGSRYRNSGQWGAESVRAASWDDYGKWIAELFRRDSNARIGFYDGQDEFHRLTARRYALHK